MPTRIQVKVCTHIKVTGVRCGSPALRGEQFCYFHQRMIRTVKGPDSRLHHVALLENEEAIQASLMEVVNALIRGTIDLPRAELVLRALNTAVRNIRRARFDNASKMVTQLPDYSEPAPAAASTANVGTATEASQARVGTDAFVRPGGPDSSGRSAADPTQPKAPVSDKSAQVLQSHKQRAPSG